jgi:hypothetical protein
MMESLRSLIDHEIARVGASGPQESDEISYWAPARRLVTLYRSLLHLLLSHQVPFEDMAQ